jgi:hypothetical protein
MPITKSCCSYAHCSMITAACIPHHVCVCIATHVLILHEQGLLELAVTAQRAVVAAEPDGRVTSSAATSSATSTTGGNSTTSSAGGARRSSGDSSRASASSSSSSSSAQQPSGYAARCVVHTHVLVKHMHVHTAYCIALCVSDHTQRSSGSM